MIGRRYAIMASAAILLSVPLVLVSEVSVVQFVLSAALATTMIGGLTWFLLRSGLVHGDGSHRPRDH